MIQGSVPDHYSPMPTLDHYSDATRARCDAFNAALGEQAGALAVLRTRRQGLVEGSRVQELALQGEGALTAEVQSYRAASLDWLTRELALSPVKLDTLRLGDVDLAAALAEAERKLAEHEAAARERLKGIGLGDVRLIGDLARSRLAARVGELRAILPSAHQPAEMGDLLHRGAVIESLRGFVDRSTPEI